MAGSFLGGLAGGAIGSAVVKLYVDDKQFKQGLTSAEGATKSAGSTAARFGNIAKAGFAAAAAGAVAFGAAAIAAAQEHEVAVQRLTMALGGNTDAITDQANALQMTTGFSDEAILEADTLLSKYDLTAQQLQELNPLILDTARFMGVDATTAASGLGKALLGSTKFLKTMGIEFEATGNRTVDLNALMAELTDKVEGTAEAFGKTSAGQAEILQQKFDELQETIGGYLIPALQALVVALTWLLENLPKLTALVAAFAAAWVVANWAQVAAAISNIALLLRALPGYITATTASLGGMAVAGAGAAASIAGIAAIVPGVNGQKWLEISDALDVMRDHGYTADQAVNLLSQDFDVNAAAVQKAFDENISYGDALVAVQGEAEATKNKQAQLTAEMLASRKAVRDAGKEYRSGLKEAFAVAGESVFGFKAKFTGTVRNFTHGLDEMRRRARETFQDLREFNKIDLGEGVKQFLLDQGPAAIDVFVDANKDGRKKIVNEIQAIIENQHKQGREIDEATGKTVNLTDAMEALGRKKVTAEARIRYMLSEDSLDPGSLPGLGANG